MHISRLPIANVKCSNDIKLMTSIKYQPQKKVPYGQPVAAKQMQQLLPNYEDGNVNIDVILNELALMANEAEMAGPVSEKKGCMSNLGNSCAKGIFSSNGEFYAPDINTASSVKIPKAAMISEDVGVNDINTFDTITHDVPDKFIPSAQPFFPALNRPDFLQTGIGQRCIIAPDRRYTKAYLDGDYIEKVTLGDAKYDEIIDEFLIPFCSFNYLTLDYFEDLQSEAKIDGREVFSTNYKSNIPRGPEEDPGRFCGNGRETINFYEPRVFRCHPVQEFHHQGRDGLCPYCKPDREYEGTSADLDRLFFNMNSSAYLHHVTKQHGVYSGGKEMPLPLEIGKIHESKKMKSGIRTIIVEAATCPICRQKIKIQRFDDPSLDGHNRFLGYFRHMLKHNKKKNLHKAKDNGVDP